MLGESRTKCERGSDLTSCMTRSRSSDKLSLLYTALIILSKIKPKYPSQSGSKDHRAHLYFLGVPPSHRGLNMTSTTVLKVSIMPCQLKFGVGPVLINMPPGAKY